MTLIVDEDDRCLLNGREFYGTPCYLGTVPVGAEGVARPLQYCATCLVATTEVTCFVCGRETAPERPAGWPARYDGAQW